MRASTLSIPRRVSEASALLGSGLGLGLRFGLGLGLGLGPRVRANIVDAGMRDRVREHEARVIA